MATHCFLPHHQSVGSTSALPDQRVKVGQGCGLMGSSHIPQPSHLSDHPSEEALRGLTLPGNVGT